MIWLSLWYIRQLARASPTSSATNKGSAQKVYNTVCLGRAYGAEPNFQSHSELESERKNKHRMAERNKYSIIIPTYNERLNIALVVYLVFKHLR